MVVVFVHESDSSHVNKSSSNSGSSISSHQNNDGGKTTDYPVNRSSSENPTTTVPFGLPVHRSRGITIPLVQSFNDGDIGHNERSLMNEKERKILSSSRSNFLCLRRVLPNSFLSSSSSITTTATHSSTPFCSFQTCKRFISFPFVTNLKKLNSTSSSASATTSHSSTSSYRDRCKRMGKLLTLPLCIFILLILKRYIHATNFFHSFLRWMQTHPRKGIAAYMLVYALHLVLLFPGTPLVLGAGYVYKTTYGWTKGIVLCSIISLLGSLLGSIIAFLLARYCFKECVQRRWNSSSASSSSSSKMAFLQALDATIVENGFKIMVMLYLTPITPLGPLSYMMGTTNIQLSSFVKAKIAALPLTVLYVFLGASTGTLFLSPNPTKLTNVDLHGNSVPSNNRSIPTLDISQDPTIPFNSTTTTSIMHPTIETEESVLSPHLILLGIVLSIFSISLITLRMKKELEYMIEKQNKVKEKFDLESFETTKILSSNSDHVFMRQRRN